MRKGERGVSAIGASGFPFAFPAEVLFVLQMGKQAGKSAPESRF